MNPRPQFSAAEGLRPGAVLLREFMEPLGLTGYRVAKELSLAPITVSEILRGLRSISPMVACRLGRYFGVPAAYWLTLQAGYDAHLASHNGAANGVELCDVLRKDADLREQLRLKVPANLLAENGSEENGSGGPPKRGRAAKIGIFPNSHRPPETNGLHAATDSETRARTKERRKNLPKKEPIEASVVTPKPDRTVNV